MLLIAGGVGITPMRALFETLPGGPGDITLLYRAGAEEQLVLRAELEAIAAERQAGLHYLLGPSGAGYEPLAPQALAALVPDLAERDVYLCGPPGMSGAAQAGLLRAGVPAGRIHSECFGF
ncbi:hypothetical protein [Streptomyces sp. NBC_00162]|uniref:hypothetical protein n=1 Tax=Streptomyces sp. NBC_00162 TaxID=2903629 RepID=UPI00214AB88A|nr:hypothetical protein [Streptomyces sp. NBC_00162]UUU42118.1 hypothetical protein JIW86_26875 [Streptomyces sp. NBC_00162]